MEYLLARDVSIKICRTIFRDYFNLYCWNFNILYFSKSSVFRPTLETNMISDIQLAIFANVLGVSLFLLVVLYHYIASNPRVA